MSDIRVGMFSPVGQFAAPAEQRDAMLQRIAEAGMDHVCVAEVQAGRDASGFRHSLNVWCGFGPSRDAARFPLASAMSRFYQAPFEPFERYSPYGTAEDVAEFLHPYIEAGCSTFDVIACADDHEAAVAGVAELKGLLTRNAVPSNS